MIAVALGGAKGGLEELAEVSARMPVAKIFAVNDVAAEYPGHVDYFVTLHPSKLDMWLDKRQSLGLSPPDHIIAHVAERHVTEVVSFKWPEMKRSGSSGLFAAKIAIEKTDLPVVLCGIPMDADRTHYAESNFVKHCDEFRPAWQEALPHIRGRVTSMSGWTAELLGRPAL